MGANTIMGANTQLREQTRAPLGVLASSVNTHWSGLRLPPGMLYLRQQRPTTFTAWPCGFKPIYYRPASYPTDCCDICPVPPPYHMLDYYVLDYYTLNDYMHSPYLHRPMHATAVPPRLRCHAHACRELRHLGWSLSAYVSLLLLLLLRLLPEMPCGAWHRFRALPGCRCVPRGVDVVAIL